MKLFYVGFINSIYCLIIFFVIMPSIEYMFIMYRPLFNSEILICFLVRFLIAIDLIILPFKSTISNLVRSKRSATAKFIISVAGFGYSFTDS